MIENLFDYDGFDFTDSLAIQLYNATSKVEIGSYPVGSEFSVVGFDFESGQLSLDDEVFNMRLSFENT